MSWTPCADATISDEDANEAHEKCDANDGGHGVCDYVAKRRVRGVPARASGCLAACTSDPLLLDLHHPERAPHRYALLLPQNSLQRGKLIGGDGDGYSTPISG